MALRRCCRAAAPRRGRLYRNTLLVLVLQTSEALHVRGHDRLSAGRDGERSAHGRPPATARPEQYWPSDAAQEPAAPGHEGRIGARSASEPYRTVAERVLAVMFVLAVCVAVLVNGTRFLSTVTAYYVFMNRKKLPREGDGTETKSASPRSYGDGVERRFSVGDGSDASGTPERREAASFPQYFLYHVGNWMTYTTYASLRILVEIFSYMLIVGTLMYLEVADHSVSSSLYSIFVWLVAPDGGHGEPTLQGMLVGATISLWGLLFFAFLMTILGQVFDDYIAGLRAGSTPVLEAGHIVILGFTDDTLPLVRELSAAHEDTGGVTIAILSPLPKPEVEGRLAKKGLLVGEGLKGSRVMVRTGFPHRPQDLELVSVDLCRTAIPMPDRTLDKDARDVFMLQVVAAVRSRDWPTGAGQVLVFYSVERDLQLFQNIGGMKASMVNLDTLISCVAVSCSHQSHTASIIEELVSFDGNDVHIAPVPHRLRGMALSEMELYFPDCIILGLIDKFDLEDVDLCPSFDVKVEKGKDLILIAEDAVSCRPRLEPAPSPPPLPCPSGRQSTMMFPSHKKQKEEHVLIIGWCHVIGSLLVVLDRLLPPGSLVSSFDDSEPDDRRGLTRRALKRHLKEEWTNIRIHYYQGQPGSSCSLLEAGWNEYGVGEASFPRSQQPSRTLSPLLSSPTPQRPEAGEGLSSRQLIEIPSPPEAPVSTSPDGQVSEPSAPSPKASRRSLRSPIDGETGIHWDDITRVFVLSEPEKAPWQSDAFAIAAAKHVMALVPEETPVVVELLENSSKDVSESIGIQDIVSSASLPAQVMAALSLQPRLKEVYLRLLGCGEYEIRIVKPLDYFPGMPGRGITTCFSRVSVVVRPSGDVLVGWRVGGPESPFVLNPPDKNEEVLVTAEVDLVVVTKRGRVVEDLAE